MGIVTKTIHRAPYKTQSTVRIVLTTREGCFGSGVTRQQRANDQQPLLLSEHRRVEVTMRYLSSASGDGADAATFLGCLCAIPVDLHVGWLGQQASRQAKLLYTPYLLCGRPSQVLSFRRVLSTVTHFWRAPRTLPRTSAGYGDVRESDRARSQTDEDTEKLTVAVRYACGAYLARFSDRNYTEPTSLRFSPQPEPPSPSAMSVATLQHFTQPGTASDRQALDKYLEDLLQSHWYQSFSKGYLLVRPPPNM